MNKDSCRSTSESTTEYPNPKIFHFILLSIFIGSKYLIKVLLERETQGLCWKVPDNIDPVSPPQRNNTLFFDTSDETICGSFVWLGDLLVLALGLHEELDSLNGSYYGFGYDSGNTTGHEIFPELGLLLCLVSH